MLEVLGDSATRRRARVRAAHGRRRPDRRRRRARAGAAARRPDAARGGRRAGETLAADALANALAQVFRAAPAPGPDRRRDERRRRQRGRAPPRGSGGDRRHAPPLARPGRPRLRARLLLAGGRDRGPRDLPRARASARDARPARGVPPRGRRAVRARPTRAARRRTRAGAATASFRFDELLAFAERAGAGKLWTGHYARIVERDGRRLLARAADPEKDQSYMLAPLDPALLGRIEFPLGERTKAETRAEAAAAGLDVAERRESQEACFLAGDDYRAFLERRGLGREDGRDRGRAAATSSAATTASWRYTPGQRRGIGVAAAEPLYALRTDARIEHARRRPARLARHARRVACDGTPARAGRRAPRRSSATARRRVPARVEPTDGRIPPRARGAGLRRRARADRRSLRREGAVVGCGLVSSAERI